MKKMLLTKNAFKMEVLAKCFEWPEKKIYIKTIFGVNTLCLKGSISSSGYIWTVFEGTRPGGCSKHLAELTTDLDADFLKSLAVCLEPLSCCGIDF